jgi:ferredoxin
MNVKFLKPIRVVISLMVLISISFIFIDFRQILSSQAYSAITYFQFVPSLLRFLHWTGILSLGFIGLLLITLLYGRVYCSMLCPLGILQDVITYISKKVRFKKVRFKYAKPSNILRYSLLAGVILSVLFGSITLLTLLDPYSNFGRFFSDLGRPVYTLGNNLLANILMKMKIYSVAPFDIIKINWMMAIYPVLLLGVVVWLSVTKGRLYCNTICPVGTFLGLISRYSIFQIKIDQGACTKCAKCTFVCKSQCINLKEQTVDASRCVGCFNCMNSCENNGISYKMAYSGRKGKIGSSETDESKRSFIASSIMLAGAFAGIAKSARVNGAEVPSGDNSGIAHRKHYSSPPGSKSISHFNHHCTACHLCVSACPNGVLQPSLFQYGWTGMLQPYMDYHSGFCNYACTKCGEVCPNGAISTLTVAEKKTCQIGIAQFVQKECIVYTKGTSCGSCSEHCPTQAVKMVPYLHGLTIPQMTEDICIGCGACERVCPAKPNKAIYVEGHDVHKIAKKPESKKVETKQIEEFPF